MIVKLPKQIIRLIGIGEKKMAREKYNNGDEITLQENGCDGCSPAMINDILCHEHGCPDMWRDYGKECKWCGQTFYPEDKDQQFCEDSCARSYHGIDEPLVDEDELAEYSDYFNN